jgi:sigma-B regulation protein RsbU (phosphoserine phosphatase)
MSNQSQSTIEIPRNFADAQAFASSMAEQLRMAGLVQRDFLPRVLPETERIRWSVTFLPAEVVSGDFYDVARLDERHIGFYIADVVGHGMPAALLTMFLKQAVVMRETTGNSYHIFTPEQVLSNLNRRMTEQELSGSQFATCCYFLLNIETLELTFARGGHPYPILIRRGENPRQLQTTGPLIGVFENAQFPQQTLKLQSGDKILLYSDGAGHVIGGYGDNRSFVFSKELYSIKELPIKEMNDRFNLFVQNQQANISEADDITMIGLEII